MWEFFIFGMGFVFFVAGAYKFHASRSELTKEKNKEAAFKTAHAPVVKSEEEFKRVAAQYEKLKTKYRADWQKIREDERRISLYDLGGDSMDATRYIKTSEAFSLDSLELSLSRVRQKITQMKKDKTACECMYGKDVHVDGKRSEAKKLFNREIKLRIRCLDNEFKMANAIAEWNNINRLIQRCNHVFKEINKSGDIVKTYLRAPYLELKVTELRLEHEIKTLKAFIKEQEREEKRIEREAEREEMRLTREREKAVEDRRKMEKLIEKELENIDSATPEQIALINEYKSRLIALKQREARAISMAQLTRAGYVYVATNPRSFGEGICKIGMTRRLNPRDRIKELSDASVPFHFETIAFAFSEDAPALEKHLHNLFADKRVNLVNSRKEFFFADYKDVINSIRNYDKPVELREFPLP